MNNTLMSPLTCKSFVDGDFSFMAEIKYKY